jgi:glutamate-1-semialdehyde 2,1-aminomutase
MAAGLAMLELIREPGFHAELDRKTRALADGLLECAKEAGVPFSTNHVCGMFGLFFTPGKVETYAQATACDIAAFRRCFRAMLEHGVYIAPSPFEAGFMSSAHSGSDIAETLEAARAAFRLAAAG